MVPIWGEEIYNVSSGELEVSFRGVPSLFRWSPAPEPFLLQLASPPGGAFGVHVWAAREGERNWDGIERSIQRVYPNDGHSDPMDARTIDLAGGERDVVCLVKMYSIRRLVTCVVRLERGRDALMLAVHAHSQASTAAEFLASPDVAAIVTSLRLGSANATVA